MKKIKFAFHVHTCYSRDSWSKPKDIIDYCRKNGIEAIAICDHNEINGAIECTSIARGNPVVIVGEEIKSKEGEIIGLFLKEKISQGQTLENTIKEIKKQSGLVCIPHPGETFRHESLSRITVESIVSDVEIIEGYNSRTLLINDMKWATNIAQSHSKLLVAGSDSHSLKTIGYAINNINNFSDKETFLSVLKTNKIEFAQSGLCDQFFSKIIKLLKKFDRSWN